MKKLIILKILLITAFMSSCIPVAQNPKEESFSKLYPNIKLNDSILIEPLNPNDKYKIGFPFYLHFSNISTKDIIFTIGDNENIYYYFEDKDEWIKINEKKNYLSPGKKFILSPKSTSDDYDSVTKLYPNEKLFPKDNKPVSIRVVISGNFYEDQTVREPVVSYYDVILEPLVAIP